MLVVGSDDDGVLPALAAFSAGPGGKCLVAGPQPTLDRCTRLSAEGAARFLQARANTFPAPALPFCLLQPGLSLYWGWGCSAVSRHVNDPWSFCIISHVFTFCIISRVFTIKKD